jgi:uncharacterized UBP type Zn finger protein
MTARPDPTLLEFCPDCHHQQADRQPIMYCLTCERAICQQCSRAHPGAVVKAAR